MQLTPLTAISPIDGRYNNATQQLAEYFSEFALIKYRLHVEVEYFIMLGERKFFKTAAKLNNELRKLVSEFSLEDAALIKATEAITNHDVKAVEYFLKQKLEDLGAGAFKEWVHFG
ncbi:MAG: adenylosuccinate lyase, partial [Chitinophagaceae bacterium]